MVRPLWSPQVEELETAGHLMPCEYVYRPKPDLRRREPFDKCRLRRDRCMVDRADYKKCMRREMAINLGLTVKDRDSERKGQGD